MPRTKMTEGVKWRIIVIRDAGMKKVDIAGALILSQTVVRRLLKKQRETGSVEKNKRSTLILECKELLLERSDKLCIFVRPYAAVKGSKPDFKLSKVLGRNSGN